MLPGLKAPGLEDKIPVTLFDFSSMLQSLLTDEKLFGSLDNLDVNPESPFERYKGETSHIRCANGGTWYKNAWKELCTSDKDCLVPIIFSCDETSMGKCGACPLLFTTSLLKQELRNKPSAWRPLGFIYDLKLITSKKQSERMSGDLKCLRLQEIFRVVLQSYKDAQDGDILSNISLKFGKKYLKTVALYWRYTRW